jgi:hypothetical protein
MTKSAFPARWLDDYKLPSLDPVLDESSVELLELLDDVFPDFLPDVAVPALLDPWLSQLWTELSSRHFGGTLPACRIAWAENLRTPARLEDANTVLIDTRLMGMSGDADRAVGIIGLILLHCAVLVVLKGYGPVFQITANRIGASLALRPVKSLDDARRWLFRR